MVDFPKKARTAAAFAAEVISETLWPTRCAVCDAPGQVLCERCAASLPYLDWWRACKRCGSAFGSVQCDTCNPVVLERMGRCELPYAACAGAAMFSPEVGHIVRVYKDQGERRLAAVMAGQMVRALPPDWPVDAITFVPATLAAVRFRGFDHSELLARQVAEALGLSCVRTLARPKTRDQRQLSGKQRVSNLAGRFEALDGSRAPLRVLLVDDVYTTGATMCAATDALKAAGSQEVRCLTFARV